MKYIIADPTKNITVLVTEAVDRQNYKAVANDMFAAVKACEQVGFLIEPNHLEMASLEFCGNATLSAAAYFADKKGLTDGEISVTCSGVEGEIPVKLQKLGIENGNPTYRGTLEMPYPKKIEYVDSHPVVFLPGIAHMIMPKDRFTKRQVENNIKDYADKFPEVGAFGILLWDEEASFMEPCVYCRDIDTVIWEHGCATGSTCVGFYRAYLAKCATITTVNQPGGTIVVSSSPDEEKITLTGNVTLCINTYEA